MSDLDVEHEITRTTLGALLVKSERAGGYISIWSGGVTIIVPAENAPRFAAACASAAHALTLTTRLRCPKCDRKVHAKGAGYCTSCGGKLIAITGG